MSSVQNKYKREIMKLTRLLIVAVTALVMSFTCAAQSTAKKSVKTDVTKVATGKVALVDINSATAAELKAIPGIGDAYSEKIIKGRPYKGKDELVQKNILPKGVYDKVKGKIIAKQ